MPACTNSSSSICVLLHITDYVDWGCPFYHRATMVHQWSTLTLWQTTVQLFLGTGTCGCWDFGLLRMYCKLCHNTNFRNAQEVQLDLLIICSSWPKLLRLILWTFILQITPFVKYHCSKMDCQWHIDMYVSMYSYKTEQQIYNLSITLQHISLYSIHFVLFTSEFLLFSADQSSKKPYVIIAAIRYCSKAIT